MTTRLASLVALALVGILIFACGSVAPPSEPSAPTLAGTSWKAVSVAGNATVVGREPKIEFASDRVTGTGGCNGFGGTYTFANGVLKFGEMPMTLIGCEDPIGSIETAFMGILTQVITVSIDDGGQLILDGPGGRALLVPATR